MFSHTHNGTERIEWPDGGCYFTQPTMLIEMWAIITDEIIKYRKEKNE